MLSRIKFELTQLVNEILDQLPSEVWTSKTTTFLDPAIAGGQFVRAIEQRLRDAGHSDKNISKRVFGFDDKLHRINFARNKYKLVGNYEVRDFLSEDYNMKFDVVVGNPPYQDGNEAIWKKIAYKCMELSDIVALVTPRNIVNGKMTQKGSAGGFFEEIKPFVCYVDYNADNYFDVGKKICAWVYNKSHHGDTLVKTSTNGCLTVDINKYEYLPYNFATLLDFSIFEKLMQFPTMLDYKNYTKYPDGPHLVIPQVKHISLNHVVVAENLHDHEKVTAKEIVGYKLDKSEMAGCESYVKSKLFKYVFNLFGGVDVRAGIFKKFPKIDFTKVWTDEELYKHFNLTDEEIQYIENV